MSPPTFTLPYLDRGDYLSACLFVYLFYYHDSMLDLLQHLLIIATFIGIVIFYISPYLYCCWINYLHVGHTLRKTYVSPVRK
jgi:hypothetical protein